MFTILFYLIYLYMLYRFLSKSYHFEEISPLEARIMPRFAFVMFLIHMKWELTQLLLLLPLLLLSLLIASLQASKVEIQETQEKDRHGRPVILLRKNTPYILGWLLLILAGILCSLFLEHNHLSSAHMLQEFLTELRKESLTYFFFTQKSDWYIWALTAFTNLAFTRLLIRKNPAIAAAIRKK